MITASRTLWSKESLCNEVKLVPSIAGDSFRGGGEESLLLKSKSMRSRQER